MSERAAIEAELLRWMGEPDWRDDPGRFSDLALRLFAFQRAHCEPFRRFCQARGRLQVRDWREIPPVPTGAFKELALRCFPERDVIRTFRTSGTTTSARGALYLDTLALYEASLRPAFHRHVLPDGPLPLRVLAPGPEEAPDSSLSAMFGALVRDLPGSDFYVRAGRLESERLRAELRAARSPVALCGTAFSFVHLLDALGGETVSLPEGSRVMETGGFKGRSREMARDELYGAIAAGLGVPAERIVNQYGMTELGSQFYDSVLARPGEPRRKLAPPWTRVRLLDPETGDDAAPGAVGAICVYDLANTGSVLAVQTADLGRRVEDGFEVLGRDPGAEERGCSVAADLLLAESGA